MECIKNIKFISNEKRIGHLIIYGIIFLSLEIGYYFFGIITMQNICF